MAKRTERLDAIDPATPDKRELDPAASPAEEMVTMRVPKDTCDFCLDGKTVEIKDGKARVPKDKTAELARLGFTAA